MSLPFLFFYFPALTSFALIVIGLAAAIKPDFMAPRFGIVATGSARPYVVSTGIRDVALGLIVLVLYLEQAWTALGWSHLFVAIVAVSDCLVVRKNGDKRVSWVHLTGAVALIIFAVVTLRYS